MNYIEKLAFKAALRDLWAEDDPDPEPIFARQGLAIVPIGAGRADETDLIERFVDELTHDAGLTVDVKDRIDGPCFTAVDVADIRRFAEDFFDE